MFALQVGFSCPYEGWCETLGLLTEEHANSIEGSIQEQEKTLRKKQGNNYFLRLVKMEVFSPGHQLDLSAGYSIPKINL